MADTRSKTIAGHVFELPIKYAEGHVCTALEARQLNQSWFEGIGNNMRAQVKELIEADNVAGAEAAVAEYAQSYEFTAAGTGTGRGKLDPVEKEARRLARELYKAKAAQEGTKLSDLDKDHVAQRIAEIAEMDEVVKDAKRIVNARNKTTDAALEGISL